jgi:hypothetical protein
MYNNTAFEGVKILKDYDAQYFISVFNLDKTRYQTPNAMFRVANVKALRQASEFVNGGKITSDLVIRTTEVKDSTTASTCGCIWVVLIFEQVIGIFGIAVNI